MPDPESILKIRAGEGVSDDLQASETLPEGYKYEYMYADDGIAGYSRREDGTIESHSHPNMRLRRVVGPWERCS